MNPLVASILSGALAALITSLLAVWASHRKLVAELRSKNRDLLIGKQLAACEGLWTALAPLSSAPGVGRLLEGGEDGPYLRVAETRAFCESLTRHFYGSGGLYFSRQLRKELFGLRDYLAGQVGSGGSGEAELGARAPMTQEGVAKYRDKIQRLTQAIRREVGLEDLRLSGKALRDVD